MDGAVVSTGEQPADWLTSPAVHDAGVVTDAPGDWLPAGTFAEAEAPEAAPVITWEAAAGDMPVVAALPSRSPRRRHRGALGAVAGLLVAAAAAAVVLAGPLKPAE